MPLGHRIFVDFPFDTGTVLDPVDTYTADGILTTFTLLYKTGLLVGNIVLVDSVVYYRDLGAFDVVGNTIVFPTAPPAGAKIVVPGMGYLPISCTDRSSDGSNVGVRHFFYVDADTIHLYKYQPTPPETDILISAYDMITSSGAQEAWTQFALADGNGDPGVYGAAGDPLRIPAIEVQDEAQVDPSGDDITVADGSQFEEGWLIAVNAPGQSNFEVVTIVSIAGDVLTTSGFNYIDHVAGEPVYHCGIKGYMKTTVPDNATGHAVATLVDVGLRRQGRMISR